MKLKLVYILILVTLLPGQLPGNLAAGEIELPFKFGKENPHTRKLEADNSWTIKDGVYRQTMNFPQEYSLGLHSEKNPWSNPQRLCFRICVSPENPDEKLQKVEVSVGAKTFENYWFQFDSPDFLKPGQWTEISISLSPQQGRWKRRGHFAPWTEECRQDLQSLTIKVYSKFKKQQNARVAIDNIRLVSVDKQAADQQLRIVDFRSSAPTVRRYEKFELSFRLNQTFKNPFDDDRIRVYALFRPEAGQVRVPGFYYQQFRRKLVPGSYTETVDGKQLSTQRMVEHLIPVGPKMWKVRFAPRMFGNYTYQVIVETGPRDKPTKKVSTKWLKFKCIDGPSKGFIKRSQTDYRYFETDDGSFFFPIGKCLISPWDEPYKQAYVTHLPKGKRTYAYDHYFKKMGDNNANVARIWMSFWWVGLEWKRGQGPYHNVGRYSLENAWRLDHLLETAEKYDIKLLLELFTHVNLSTKFPIAEQSGWKHNPYNVFNGGWLRKPEHFFTDYKAKRQIKKLIRYIIARYGYSTSVFAWSMFSEIDLVDNFAGRDKNSEENVYNSIRNWHGEMFKYIKEIDNVGLHLCTSHHHQPKKARLFFELGDMDMATSNAYASTFLVDDQIPAFLEYCEALNYLQKPNFITEFGGHWGGSPREVMIRDFHNGLWFSIASPLAGTPLFWWWNMVDDADLYPQYKALANYLEGEDFRNRQTKQQNDWARHLPKASEKNIPLGTVSFGDGKSRRIWVFNRMTCQKISPYKIEVLQSKLKVQNLESGKYMVEFWDTFDPKKGKLGQVTAKTTGNTLEVSIPRFDKDIAVKVKHESVIKTGKRK